MTSYKQQTLELSTEEAGLVASALRMLAKKKRKNYRNWVNRGISPHESLTIGAEMCDALVKRLKSHEQP